jgi:hypothetical protein
VGIFCGGLLQWVGAGYRLCPRIATAALAVGAVCHATPAAAQLSHPLWGVGASFTPTWRTPDYQHVLFEADSVTLSGSEFTVGVVRGDQLKADWGVSFVRRSFKPEG